MAKKQKYDEWLTEDGLLRLQGWARDGLTEVQIAQNIGINVSTLYTWKNKYSEIHDALKGSKEIADRIVENSLYKKANGFFTTIKKSHKVKDIEYENGRKVREVERIELIDEEIYIPPDTTAQIFWLKNRKTAEWRDKREYDIGGKDGDSIKIEMSEEVKKWAK